MPKKATQAFSDYRCGGRVKTKKARLMTKGGRVHAKGNVPKTINVRMNLEQSSGADRVPAILAAGELVIPKRLAPKVTRFLKASGDRIPGL